MRYLHEAFRAEFLRVLRDSKMTRTEAAKRMRVSRQAFQAYIAEENGAVPRKEHYERIFEVWPDFQVVAEDGQVILNKAFTPPNTDSKPRLIERQMNLFETLRSVKQENLRFKVEEVDGATQLIVFIRVPA